MTAFENTAQQIIFTALSGVISTPVTDDPDFLPEGLPTSGFPFVAIGNDTNRAFGADDVNGSNSTITIHVWSRSPGFNECKLIMGEIYDQLHKATLTKAGYKVVDCIWEFSDTMLDQDGETRHGVTRYRLHLQKT